MKPKKILYQRKFNEDGTCTIVGNPIFTKMAKDELIYDTINSIIDYIEDLEDRIKDLEYEIYKKRK